MIRPHEATELELNVVGDNSLDEAEVELMGAYIEATDGEDAFEQRAVPLSLLLLDSRLVKSPALKGKASFGQKIAEALEGGVLFLAFLSLSTLGSFSLALAFFSSHTLGSQTLTLAFFGSYTLGSLAFFSSHTLRGDLERSLGPWNKRAIGGSVGQHIEEIRIFLYSDEDFDGTAIVRAIGLDEAFIDRVEVVR